MTVIDVRVLDARLAEHFDDLQPAYATDGSAGLDQYYLRNVDS